MNEGIGYWPARRAVACAGKVSFSSRAHALTAARRKDMRSPYLCPYCQQWHIGNDERTAARKRRQRRPVESLEP